MAGAPLSFSINARELAVPFAAGVTDVTAAGDASLRDFVHDVIAIRGTKQAMNEDRKFACTATSSARSAEDSSA